MKVKLTKSLQIMIIGLLDHLQKLFCHVMTDFKVVFVASILVLVWLPVVYRNVLTFALCNVTFPFSVFMITVEGTTNSRANFFLSPKLDTNLMSTLFRTCFRK